MKQHSNLYLFLVDDEPIHNENLKNYLEERFEYKIKVYDSEVSVLKDMNLNPEIIILDFHLNTPDSIEHGIEVLKKIKNLKPLSKVIMLSGQDNLQVAVDCMKNGAYDYVVKGETAFSNIENSLNNISELQASNALNKTYKNIISFLIVFVVIILAVTFLFLRKL